MTFEITYGRITALLHGDVVVREFRYSRLDVLLWRVRRLLWFYWSRWYWPGKWISLSNADRRVCRERPVDMEFAVRVVRVLSPSRVEVDG